MPSCSAMATSWWLTNMAWQRWTRRERPFGVTQPPKGQRFIPCNPSGRHTSSSCRTDARQRLSSWKYPPAASSGSSNFPSMKRVRYTDNSATHVSLRAAHCSWPICHWAAFTNSTVLDKRSIAGKDSFPGPYRNFPRATSSSPDARDISRRSIARDRPYGR